MQFARCFLLQGRSGERRSREALKRTCLDVRYHKLCILALLKEGSSFFLGLESCRELGIDDNRLVILVKCGKRAGDTIALFRLELLDLAFTLYNEAYGNALYTSCRELWHDLAPEDRRDLIAHDTIKHTTSLLCIDEIDVDRTRRLDGIEDCRFGDFVKDDALGLGLVETEHLRQVPADSLSLAVFIGCQPYGLCFRSRRL